LVGRLLEESLVGQPAGGLVAFLLGGGQLLAEPGLLRLLVDRSGEIEPDSMPDDVSTPEPAGISSEHVTLSWASAPMYGAQVARSPARVAGTRRPG